MKTTHRSRESSQGTGIYVDFRLSEDGKNRYKTEIISCGRLRLLIFLANEHREKKVKLGTKSGSVIEVRAWVVVALQIIKKVETGASWPLRFEHDNLIQFLSLEELEWIEKRLKDTTAMGWIRNQTQSISAHVYGAPKAEEKRCFDDDTIRRWTNAAARDTFAQMKAKGSAPLDGQMSLLDLVT